MNLVAGVAVVTLLALDTGLHEVFEPGLNGLGADVRKDTCPIGGLHALQLLGELLSVGEATLDDLWFCEDSLDEVLRGLRGVFDKGDGEVVGFEEAWGVASDGVDLLT